ncbi:Hypothetical predicted protein [Octopus vulgaris]|uniref:Uncharacterized protein n=2 Tax=Octopus TaxID=6643 RepID=A0AA36F0W2_OCTVU|nr:uncharacterized protein LOC115210474 [Octopus sinensis]CAI9721491.1 Hypothetical predicted protein [Octopus vulgaris]
MNSINIWVIAAISLILVQVHGKQIEKECSGKAANIIFVMDTSSSIWIVDYKKQIRFFQKMIENFHIGQSNSHVRVGAITFSDRAHLEFPLDKFTNKEDLKVALGAIPYRKGQTNTAAALQLLMKEVKPKLKVYTAPFIAIVITDGKSRDANATRHAAKLLHKVGVNVYAIGVGKRFDTKELNAIASDPANNVLLVASYSALEKIARYFGVKTCKDITTLPPTIPTTTPTTTKITTPVTTTTAAATTTTTTQATTITSTTIPTTKTTEMPPQQDQSSTVSFGYDILTLGIYRTDIITQFIQTMLPYTPYGRYRTFSFVDCPQSYNQPFTTLINKTNAELGKLIKPTYPGLTGIVRHMGKGLNMHPNLYTKQLAVLFLDPSLTVLTAELMSEIENLKQLGTKVFLINVGNTIWPNVQTLHSMSSQPYTHYIYNIPSYNQLLYTAHHSPCSFRPLCNQKVI